MRAAGVGSGGARRGPHIERLSTYASARAYARGATIFTKGDPGTSLFAVCSGTLRIAVPSLDGRDAVFNFRGRGDLRRDCTT
jgi:CRP/FNR family transcriptional regulator, cyclic AMP receptor protein